MKYTDDDYCDIYENKICDNCGKCLEEQGIDIRAIRIEDIAKTVEENKLLEEEYMNSIQSKSDNINNLEDYDKNENDSAISDVETKLNMDEAKTLAEAYKIFEDEHKISLEDYEYEDAFDYIEYLEEDIFDENTLEDMTEEIFPGVRKLKTK